MSNSITSILKEKPNLRIKKPLVQLYPSAVERKYFKELLQYIKVLKTLTEKYLIPILPEITKQAQALKPQTDNVDTYADLLDGALVKINIELNKKYPNNKIEGIAKRAANSTSKFNKSQTKKVVSSMIGADVFLSEPYLNTSSRVFVIENTLLIKTIPQDALKSFRGIILRQARQGVRHEVLKEEILNMFGDKLKKDLPGINIEYVARRIARDQISKFNGELTELRQRELGVEQYIWRTVGDDRVRPVHRALNGTKHSWDNPPAIGHPGEPIQCRCYAEPVLAGLI